MIEIITFHNQPILKITSGTEKYTKIQFGLKKAKLIIDNIEAIKDFIFKNQKEEIKDNV